MFYHSNANESPKDISTCPVLGQAEFTLPELLKQKFSGSLILPLSNRGNVEIIGKNRHHSRDLFQFQLSGDLRTKNWINNPKPYFIISVADENHQWIRTVSYKDPTIGSTTSPVWKTLEFPIQQLCNSDKDCPIKIQIYDDINQHLIGEINEISINQIISANNIPLPLKPDGGFITFQNPKIIRKTNFLDLLQVVNLSFATAIDFTASNGHPNIRTSLHYVDKDNKSNYNIYQQCIEHVGYVIIDYDNDKRIPVHGFGAQLQSPTGQFSATSHCFSLSEEEVYGVEGIMEAYRNSFQTMKLSGPTLLEPIIRKATEDARKAAESKFNYTVYLIITDGNIQDMDETVNAVIEASNYPISFIIMGVGDGDFTNMKLLDGDEKLLKQGDKEATRDIVQFVRFLPEMHATLLAEQVLEEVSTFCLCFH